jgi:hypothetical protein
MNWFEIAGLIAPRALLLIQGENDAIFPISGARAAAEATARVFDVLGRPDGFRFVELAGQPHAYTRPFREPMYGWMTRHLRDATTAAPIVPEPPSLRCPRRTPDFSATPTGRAWSPRKPSCP